MSHISDCISPFLKSSVTIAAQTGTDATGRDTFGTGVATACHIEKTVKMVPGADNQLVLSTVAIWIDGANAVTARDKITLPGGSTPQILAIEQYLDPLNAQGILTVVRT